MGVVTRRRVKVHSDATNPGVGTIAVGDRFEVEVTSIRHGSEANYAGTEMRPYAQLMVRDLEGKGLGGIRFQGQCEIEVDR